MTMKDCGNCNGIGKVYDSETGSTENCYAPGCKEGKIPVRMQDMEGPAPGSGNGTGQ